MFAKAALAVAMISTLVAGWMWVRADRLDDENQRLNRSVAAYEAQVALQREANAVLAAHLDRAEAEAADLAAAIEATTSLEGANAPLSAYERAVLDRLLRP